VQAEVVNCEALFLLLLIYKKITVDSTFFSSENFLMKKIILMRILRICAVQDGEKGAFANTS
jgi:hypothetical protein